MVFQPNYFRSLVYLLPMSHLVANAAQAEDFPEVDFFLNSASESVKDLVDQVAAMQDQAARQRTAIRTRLSRRRLEYQSKLQFANLQVQQLTTANNEMRSEIGASLESNRQLAQEVEAIHGGVLLMRNGLGNLKPKLEQISTFINVSLEDLGPHPEAQWQELDLKPPNLTVDAFLHEVSADAPVLEQGKDGGMRTNQEQSVVRASLLGIQPALSLVAKERNISKLPGKSVQPVEVIKSLNSSFSQIDDAERETEAKLQAYFTVLKEQADRQLADLQVESDALAKRKAQVVHDRDGLRTMKDLLAKTADKYRHNLNGLAMFASRLSTTIEKTAKLARDASQ